MARSLGCLNWFSMMVPERFVVAVDQTGTARRRSSALQAKRCSVLEFILTVLVLELTPGPNMAYLATLALDRGRRAGLLATAGVAAGLSVHAIVAAFGLGVLISQF